MAELRKPLRLRSGESVRVRTVSEILATLDERGCLENLPFMPEMVPFCGKQFTVFKRAHKTCDTVHKTGGRRMHAAVHLKEVYCGGKAHAGCDAACLIFWKEAWLERPGDSEKQPHPAAPYIPETGRCTESDIWSATTISPASSSDEAVYCCQITELPQATEPLSHWDLRQYWEDLRSGNEKPWTMVGPFTFRGLYRLSQLGIGLGKPLRWLYGIVQKLLGGPPFPYKKGMVPDGTPTPTCKLNLQPGELVRVKDFDSILRTLDRTSKNRGMYFDAEEVPFCGNTYRVRSRVKRIINESTGRMMEFKNDSVILEGVYCKARYSDRRLFCPRAIFPMWREAWLERQESEPEDQ